jgi:hypothetical protein
MRMALKYDGKPTHMALGAAAGVLSMIKRQGSFEKPVPNLPKTEAELTQESLKALLLGLWGDKADTYAQEMIRLTWDALEILRRKGI